MADSRSDDKPHSDTPITDAFQQQQQREELERHPHRVRDDSVSLINLETMNFARELERKLSSLRSAALPRTDYKSRWLMRGADGEDWETKEEYTEAELRRDFHSTPVSRIGAPSPERYAAPQDDVPCVLGRTREHAPAVAAPCPDGEACPDARRYGAIHPASSNERRCMCGRVTPYGIIPEEECKLPGCPLKVNQGGARHPRCVPRCVLLPEKTGTVSSEGTRTYEQEKQAVWDMLLLDGNVGPELRGAAKLRAIIDALIEARSATPSRKEGQ